MKSALITIMLLMLTTNAVSYAITPNEKCFRCHNSPTLGVITPEYGIIKSYYVSESKFNKSNHAKLDCQNCHDGNYEVWPHSNVIKSALTCLSCHTENSVFLENNPDFGRKLPLLNFDDITLEVDKSVHTQKLGSRFTCFSCHDPHVFERNREFGSNKVKSDNVMCLNCHSQTEKYANFSGKIMPEINVTHQWLPNINLHLATVRCVDCHSSYEAPNLSHNILSKEFAVRNCENCHSKEPKLFDKLYRHTMKEDRKNLGFVNASLLSNAYVIGSTRNEFLDMLSLIIFGFTFSIILVHVTMRKFTKKNKKG